MSSKTFPPLGVNATSDERKESIQHENIIRDCAPSFTPQISKQCILPRTKHFDVQYDLLYRSRLNEYRIPFITQLKQYISSYSPLLTFCNNIPDAKPGLPSIILGITAKDMDNKPTILSDMDYKHMKGDNSSWEYNQNDKTWYNTRNYCSTNPSNPDVIFLEDDNGRVPLKFTENTKIFNSSSPHLPQNEMLDEDDKDKGIEPKIDYLLRSISQNDLVSGLMIAAEGYLIELTGEFLTEKIFFVNCYFNEITTVSNEKMSDDDTFIAFMSGINLASLLTNNVQSIYTDMLLDFLNVQLTSQPDDVSLLQRIQRVVIAGNILGPTPQNIIDVLVEQDKTQQKNKKKSIYDSKIKPSETVTQPSFLPIADHFLTRLVSSIDVTLLPGLYDPTTFQIPQQPFNTCLFPVASTYSTLHYTTNPSLFNIKNPKTTKTNIFAGSDGSPITDITKVSKHDSLSALALTFHAQHFAPTVPDSLGGYPYQKHDNLTLFMNSQSYHKIPFNDVKNKDSNNNSNTAYGVTDDNNNASASTNIDVYFSGNAPNFSSTLVESSYSISPTKDDIKTTLLLNIPSFSTTRCIILMNTRTKECIPMYFGSAEQDPTDVQLFHDLQNSILLHESAKVSIDFDDGEAAGGEDDE